jgi:chromosome segregation ATPase
VYPEESYMTIDERLEYIATLQQSHDEQIGKLVEQSARVDQRMEVLAHRMDSLAEQMGVLTQQMGVLTQQMSGLTQEMSGLTHQMGVLTQRTVQAMDSINRLARIAEIQDQRIEDLENDMPS